MTTPEEIADEMQPQLTHAEVATNNQMFSEAAERIKTLTAALEALLEAVEDDGYLIHSDRCYCGTCVAVDQARRALKGAAT